MKSSTPKWMFFPCMAGAFLLSFLFYSVLGMIVLSGRALYEKFYFLFAIPLLIALIGAQVTIQMYRKQKYALSGTVFGVVLCSLAAEALLILMYMSFMRI